MARADNALFLYRNLVDEASLAASSALVTADNLKDFRPSRIWRADGTTGYVVADFGSAQNITHGAAVAYNLGTGGTIRFRAGNDASFATSLFDETKEAWSPVSGLGYDGFGASLGGYPLLTAINDYRPYRFWDLGGTLNCRYARWDFSDAGVAGGNIEVGRVFAGLGVQFERNVGFGWSWQWEDPSELIDTEESLFIVRRKQHRILRIALPGLTIGEAYGPMDDLKRIVGRSRDLMVVLFPTGDVPQQYRTTIYGVPVEQGAIDNPYPTIFTTSLAIRELAR